MNTNTVNQLCSRGFAAEAGGNPREAAAFYREAIRLEPDNPTPYLFLGYALDTAGDSEAATDVWSLGADLDPRLINAWRQSEVDDDLRQRSKSAADELTRHFRALHNDAIRAYEAANTGADVSRIAAAIWCQTHGEPFRYRDPNQQPQLFYVPDLPPVPVYRREATPWATALEAHWETIREEFFAVQHDAADEAEPYLGREVANLGNDWQPIANSLNWSSFHLYKKGCINERLVRLAPTTMEALEAVPLARTPDGPSEILFSVLKAGQRIPPHFGVSNTDMTVHLPLVVTEDSAIRVVDEVTHWQEGQVFAFDDAFEHESWNNAETTRANLLFEVWHPDLSEHEKAAIRETIDARSRWNAARSVDH